MNNEKIDMEPKFNPVPFFKLLLKKLWLIVIVALAFAVVAFGATKILVKPTYRSSFTAYVNNQHAQSSKDSLTSSDVLAAHELVETYSTILTSNSVLTAAAKDADLDYTYAELKSMVSTKIMENTEIITVYVDSHSPDEARTLALSITKVAPEYIKNIVEGSSMKIVDYPELPQYPHGPSYIRIALISAVAGALLAILFLFIRFIRDDTLKNEEEVENRFDLPILGVIPDVTKVSNANSDYYYYSQDQGSEETVNLKSNSGSEYENEKE